MQLWSEGSYLQADNYTSLSFNYVLKHAASRFTVLLQLKDFFSTNLSLSFSLCLLPLAALNLSLFLSLFFAAFNLSLFFYLCLLRLSIFLSFTLSAFCLSHSFSLSPSLPFASLTLSLFLHSLSLEFPT